MPKYPVSPEGVLLMTNFNYDLFKVRKMTEFDYDLFKVSKMTEFSIHGECLILHVN